MTVIEPTKPSPHHSSRGSGGKRSAASQRAVGPLRAAEPIKGVPKDGDLALPTRLALAGEARIDGMKKPSRAIDIPTNPRDWADCPICAARRAADAARLAKHRAKKSERSK